VGLPSDEDMGNSEVGHNALGAGRIFEQGYVLVSQHKGESGLDDYKVLSLILKKNEQALFLD